MLAVAALCSSNLHAQTPAPPTAIDVSSTVKLSHAKRLGINLGAQAFYTSQQLMRNIMFRNPGFEGEIWQSILSCKTVTATTCTDSNFLAGWPANFLAGGTASSSWAALPERR